MWDFVSFFPISICWIVLDLLGRLRRTTRTTATACLPKTRRDVSSHVAIVSTCETPRGSWLPRSLRRCFRRVEGTFACLWTSHVRRGDAARPWTWRKRTRSASKRASCVCDARHPIGSRFGLFEPKTDEDPRDGKGGGRGGETTGREKGGRMERSGTTVDRRGMDEGRTTSRNVQGYETRCKGKEPPRRRLTYQPRFANGSRREPTTKEQDAHVGYSRNCRHGRCSTRSVAFNVWRRRTDLATNAHDHLSNTYKQDCRGSISCEKYRVIYRYWVAPTNVGPCFVVSPSRSQRKCTLPSFHARSEVSPTMPKAYGTCMNRLTTMFRRKYRHPSRGNDNVVQSMEEISRGVESDFYRNCLTCSKH